MWVTRQRRAHNRPVWKLQRRLHPRQPWQLRKRSFLIASIKFVFNRITPGRLVLVALALALLFIVGNVLTEDVLIIDPISVPRELAESGLTPDVMANRIGQRIEQIEMEAKVEQFEMEAKNGQIGRASCRERV